MEILYIIGNGFDLWHGLPTKYADFYEYSREHLDELEQHFSNVPFHETLWNNFEQSLGKYDWSLFYDDYNHIDVLDDSFKPSMVYGLEDELSQESESLVEHIQSLFQEWIESISIENTKRQFYFITPNRFISFNYTPLLQNVYGIEDKYIFHIHGCSQNFDNLIFGHGEEIYEEPELDENGESNRTMFTDAEGAAKYPLYAFQKPVNETIQKNISRFEALSNVEVVIVIGHSLNDIDLPYFKVISKFSNSCEWIVSCHDEQEGQNHLLQLSKCGIDFRKITTCKIEEIQNIFK